MHVALPRGLLQRKYCQAEGVASALILGGSKNMADKISRRAVMLGGLQIPLGGALVVALAGCGTKGGGGSTAAAATVCADPAAASEAELSTRKSLNYTEASPNPKQVCAGCSFFHAPAGGGDCGTCDMFSGRPANSHGHCDSWNAKA